ncbi:MAG: hypothetical protein J7J77_02340 [Candidatus Cloacimonetes bacterium]|nr:hypothetical protein [Candidatus Cloacimonadota bacterium]
MKTLAWIFGIIAALLMLAGCINYLAQDWLFHVSNTVSYFHVANAFLLFTIAFLVYPKIEKK